MIKIWLDSGANIHSLNKREVSFDELGTDEAEWAEMSEQERFQLVQEYWEMSGCLEIGWEE